MEAWMNERMNERTNGFNDFHAIIQPFNHAMVLSKILLIIINLKIVKADMQ